MLGRHRTHPHEGHALRSPVRLPAREQIDAAAAMFRALGDPERLRLLVRLANGEACVSELADEENVNITTVSARLKTLHGGIEPQTERYWRLYASSIIKDLHISVEEHKEIIRGVEAADADAVDTGLKQNWLKGAERLGHVIDIFGERGSW